ncbi:hypothetical protein [Pseudomonas fakonensis]|uniref:hypothetical protein n=1 Tax=Pseudomonas fakonensis TaxID=2842355 RepID=UPI001CECC58D|nr:hypothetical protein [Pseudomonas fakonensis]
MTLRLLATRALQSLGLIPVAYLFVCLLGASFGEPFSLRLPDIAAPDGNSLVELLIFTVPGQLLFMLPGIFCKNRRWLAGLFALCATQVAWLQCLLFADAFGNTWSTTEIAGLLGYNLPWLLLALAPGLALLRVTEPRRQQGT